jgi:hypothetical protein
MLTSDSASKSILTRPETIERAEMGDKQKDSSLGPNGLSSQQRFEKDE